MLKDEVLTNFDNPYDNAILVDSLNELEFNSVLNFVSRYAYSDLGVNLIKSLKPNNDLFSLNNEINLVESLKQLYFSGLKVPFEGLTDVKHKIYKSAIENAVLSSSEVLAVHDVIRAFRIIGKFFEDRREQFPLLYEFVEQLYVNKLLEKHITEAIDDNGDIRDTATKELYDIRRKITQKSQHLRMRLQKILRHVQDEDMTREDFYTVREGRFVLPIKAENKRALPGIIHGISQTGSTVFLEPSEIIELNNELSLLHNEELREIHRILSNLTNEIGKDSHLLIASLDILAHLDSMTARAKYAVDFGGIKPNVNEEDYIYLKDVRHPLLVHAKGAKKVMPLTIEFTKETRGHLISGPNAGGKTVALKSIGLNILMALSGIFPLGDCRTNFRTVFAAIGDHQSLENDLSTFSSQILNLKKILESCGKESLILVDEIGSGTDPQEGAALACGVLDSFININLFFVVTTHQSSLKTYALNNPVIANASLEFDDVKLLPTYHFLSGIPGNSYAFVLARNIGISELVLERAKKYLGSRQSELESSISLLQKYKTESQNLKNELEKEKLTFAKLNSEYEAKLNEIKLKKKDLISDAKLEAFEIVNKANSLVENTIKEIKESQKPVGEIKKGYEEAKATLKSQVETEVNKVVDAVATETDFAPGDNVVMIDNNSSGSIVMVNEEDKMAVVEFNGFKFRLPYDRIKKAENAKEKKSSTTQFVKFDAESRIDIRGRRAEESMRMIDEFISEALMTNLERITIIHGKGTGALKHAVHEFLKYHPSIKSFKLGELVEGGAGVTIAEL